MADRPEKDAAVLIPDWPGLVTHSDRRDVPPGAGSVQVNLQSERPGEMRVRRGLMPVFFPINFPTVSESVSVREVISRGITRLPSVVSESVAVAETVSVVRT